MIKCVVSSFLSITIVIASLLQFHHHDCLGNIYINVSAFNGITFGHFGIHIKNCDHFSNVNHNQGCDKRKKCALHITLSKVTKQEHQSIKVHSSVYLFCILTNLLELNNIQQELHITYYTHSSESIDLYQQTSKCRRAPPTLQI